MLPGDDGSPISSPRMESCVPAGQATVDSTILKASCPPRKA
jgi:hypothetical protein